MSPSTPPIQRMKKTQTASNSITKKKTMTMTNKKKSKMSGDRPKRPLSAYNHFFRAERKRWLEQVEKSDPSLISKKRFAKMGRDISQRWMELSREKRAIYQAMAAESYRQWEDEMALYHHHTRQALANNKEGRPPPPAQEGTTTSTTPSYRWSISGEEIHQEPRSGMHAILPQCGGWSLSSAVGGSADLEQNDDDGQVLVRPNPNLPCFAAVTTTIASVARSRLPSFQQEIAPLLTRVPRQPPPITANLHAKLQQHEQHLLVVANTMQQKGLFLLFVQKEQQQAMLQRMQYQQNVALGHLLRSRPFSL